MSYLAHIVYSINVRLSPWKPGLIPGLVHVRIVVVKVVKGQGFLAVIWLSSVSIIPPVFHFHLDLRSIVSRKTSGGILETSKQSCALSCTGEHGT
jgi:hypothetical protein